MRIEKPDIKVAEVTVRAYVRDRKLKIGLIHREIFVSQSYAWGQEGQVNWYEMFVELGGERQKGRSSACAGMASGGAFRRAYPHASQQAFLEAHELEFHYFGGVFHLPRYGNLKSAVQRILRGSQREETARFVAFRSHWSYAAEFCNPPRDNENDGVEGGGGFFWQNHLKPVPVARDYEHLNELLRGASGEDEQRIVGERSVSVGAAMALEREHLLPLVKEGFDLAAVRFPVVNNSGCEAAAIVLRRNLAVMENQVGRLFIHRAPPNSLMGIAGRGSTYSALGKPVPRSLVRDSPSNDSKRSWV